MSVAFQVSLQALLGNPLSFTDLLSVNPDMKLLDHVLSILTPRIRQSEELVHSTGIPQKMIMPGFPSEDAGVLLDLLYKERFRFLLDRSTHPRNWEGFSVLLYGIWGHMRGLGSGLNPGTLGPKLLDVACRFASLPSRNPNEDALTEIVIYTMRNIAAMFGAAQLFPEISKIPNPNVDTVSDAMTVVRCYINKLSSGTPSLKLCFHLYEWAHGLVHPDISELMILFFKASYTGLWNLLDPTKDASPMTPDRICDLVDFAGQLMAFTGTILEESIITRKNKDALLEVARQSDVIALLARILLLPLTLKDVALTQRDKKNLSELYEGLRLQIPDFGNALQTGSKSSSQLFKKSYPDWLKAVYHLQESCFMSDGNSLIHKHLTYSMRTWIAFGISALGAQPKTESTMCSYSQCPWPTLVCGMEFKCSVCPPPVNGRCGCHKLQWARHVYCDSRLRSQENSST
ncbi:hypothetical protein RhiLY_07990 [Ceratobasidium sp. AG-Ba]|nr:hypothetical protein RhiLY_07990 [Ceratobasidium sp. AG-Ba]